MSSEATRRGALMIVSAPSGTGKTTLVQRLVQVMSGVTM
jgi:guanylate kinase